MPTITGYFYGKAFTTLANKEADLNSDTLKLMLLSSSYTPDRDAHDYVDDVVANEVTGTGWSAGGVTLTTVTIGYVAANSWATARANSTAYSKNAVVRPATGNGYLYQAITAGTSGGSIPTYPTVIGDTVTDGTVTWMCVAKGAFKLAADNVATSGVTVTDARYGVIYDSTPGTNATRPLVVLLDHGSAQAATAGTFNYTWDATGIAYVLVP